MICIVNTRSSSFSSDCQIVTLRNHTLYHFIGYRTVQNHRIPVFLVLVISRYHRLVSLPPEIAPRRIDLYIDPHTSFIFISPQKSLFVPSAPHQHPVGIMKGHILISIRKSHSIVQRLFSRCHRFTIPKLLLGAQPPFTPVFPIIPLPQPHFQRFFPRHLTPKYLISSRARKSGAGAGGTFVAQFPHPSQNQLYRHALSVV